MRRAPGSVAWDGTETKAGSPPAGSRPTVHAVAEPVINNGWKSVRDHSRSFWDFTFVYPVVSRRSRGLSIGVNLNPDKVCNFDCVYCEVDRRTPPKTRTVDLGQIRAELGEMIDLAQSGELGKDPKFTEAAALTREVRDIAFSGDGEPTMVHNFDECVQAVADVRASRGLANTKIVLITDSAGLDKASVRRGLALMDQCQGEVWAKLDAGTEGYFKTVNRTHIRFDRILSNLQAAARERALVIQTLLLQLRGQPMTAAELTAYCDRLTSILAGGGRIREVHLYTIARPTPEPWATRVDRAALDSAADTVRSRTGLTVHVYE